MSEPKNVDLDRAASEAAAAAAKALVDAPGPETTAAFETALEALAAESGWDRSEVRQQIASGQYRAPGFVVVDGTGYDLELALASVGPGWAGILRGFFARKERACPGATVDQVKEKYGTLRIYGTTPRDMSMEQATAFWALVDEAEAASCTVCEDCGAPGALRQGGWIETLCDAHAGGRPPFPKRAAAAPEKGSA